MTATPLLKEKVARPRARAPASSWRKEDDDARSLKDTPPPPPLVFSAISKTNDGTGREPTSVCKFFGFSVVVHFCPKQNSNDKWTS